MDDFTRLKQGILECKKIENELWNFINSNKNQEIKDKYGQLVLFAGKVNQAIYTINSDQHYFRNVHNNYGMEFHKRLLQVLQLLIVQHSQLRGIEILGHEPAAKLLIQDRRCEDLLNSSKRIIDITDSIGLLIDECIRSGEASNLEIGNEKKNIVDLNSFKLELYKGQTLDFTPEISKDVYIISNTEVAKAMSNWTFSDLSNEQLKQANLQSICHMIHEFEITKKAYELGLQVPKPVGVFFVKLRDPSRKFSMWWKPIIAPAFVVERIFGVPYTRIPSGPDVDLAHKQKDEQLKKAKSLGFEPADYDWGDNSLWDHKRKKLFFVDVDQWAMKNEGLAMRWH